MKKQIFILGFLGFLFNINEISAQAMWTPINNAVLYNNPTTSSIGIGIGTPSEKLHVNGNIRCDNGTIKYGLSQSRTENLNNANTPALSGFYETGTPSNYPSTSSGWWHLLNVKHSNMIDNNYAMQFAGSFYDQDLYFRKTINTTSAWSKVIMANPAGNVGIGASNPTSKLHLILNTSDASSTAFRIERNDGSSTYHGLSILANGRTLIGFHPNNSGHTDAALSVDGKIVCKEVVVTIANWADYVFAKDYKLKNLNSLQNYIDKNHHLPNVPSAKEIDEKGVDLGEMSKIHMEKIEELTLYILELKKEIDQLKNKKSK